MVGVRNKEHVIKQDVKSKQTRCDELRNLVPFVQFKKLEKHPWRNVTFSKVAGFSFQLY